jgi:tRNA (guanine10-N2)-methyltransferase
MMPLQILIQFAQAHADFRIPELLSVGQTYGFDIVLPSEPDVTRPFMTVELQQEESARLLAERCILVKFALPSLHPDALSSPNAL